MQPDMTAETERDLVPPLSPNQKGDANTLMEPAGPVVKKKEPRRHGTTLPPELRDLEKLIGAFGEEFSFAREEVGKLKTKLALVIEAWRRAEARHGDEHHQVRAKLNTLFNGPRIE